MKNTFIYLKTTGLVLAVAGFALSVPAVPTSISGSISFSGTSTMDATSFVTATRFTSFQDVFVGAASSVSGDYVGTSGATVTLSPFIWDPPTGSTPLNPLWTFESGGNTYSFDLDVLHKDLATPTELLLSGLGTARITGPGLEKVETAGLWNFSAQTQGLSTFTFSSTTTVPAPSVPDGGASVVLLGASMLGLGLMRRKQVA